MSGFGQPSPRKKKKIAREAERDPADTSVPLPRSLRPPRGGQANRRRGRPGQRNDPPPDQSEKNICFVCKGDPDAKPPVPPKHLHDFSFRARWACQCRHPGHGLPKNKRT